MFEKKATPPTSDVIANHVDEIDQIKLEGSRLAVQKARNSLLIATGVILAADLNFIYRQLGTLNATGVVLPVAAAVIFSLLALWTKPKPYTALICAIAAVILYRLLLVFLHGYIDGFVTAGKALLTGSLIAVLILIKIIPALPDAKKLQEAKEEK